MSKQRMKLSPEEISKANGQLRRSVMMGDYALAEKLFSEGVVNIQESPCDLLYIALANRDTPMVKLLLVHGAKINSTEVVIPSDNKKASHFWCALQELNVEISKLFIDADANVTVQRGTAPFSNVYSIDSSPRTMYPLQYCISRNQEELIKILLKYTDINVCDDQGDSVLSYAITYKLSDLTLELLKMGADFNARNKAGYTIIHIAALTGSLELVKRLLKMNADEAHPRGVSLLHSAVRSVSTESLDLMEMLLKRGYSVDATDSNGDTPLHTVLRPTNATIVMIKAIAGKVELLLKYGADLNKKNVISGESSIAVLALRRIDYPTNDPEWVQTHLRKTTNPRLTCLMEAYAHFVPIIKQIFKLRFNNRPISEEDSEIIFNHPCLNFLYEEHELQYKELEKLIIYGNYSVANVFAMDDKYLALHVSFTNLANSFFKLDLQSFPLFSIEMKQKFDNALEIKKRLNKWESDLNSVFNQYLPEIAIRKISLYSFKESLNC